jgi:hypothetical protein
MKLISSLTLALVLFFVSTAHAELGSFPLISSATLTIRAISRLPSPKPTLYSIRKLVTSDDIEIHEFVLPSNVVFALSWQGSTKPDMRVLLGAYFSRYADELSRPAAGRMPVAIQETNLVIQTGGRMNQFFGLAFVPTMAPNGVQISEIR